MPFEEPIPSSSCSGDISFHEAWPAFPWGGVRFWCAIEQGGPFNVKKQTIGVYLESTPLRPRPAFGSLPRIRQFPEITLVESRVFGSDRFSVVWDWRATAREFVMEVLTKEVMASFKDAARKLTGP